MPPRPTLVPAGGMLPRNEQRPPFFAFAVSLYRADLLFRSLVDLTMAGLAVLAFTGAFAAVWKPLTSAVQNFNQPVADIHANPDRFTAPEAGPGREVLLAVGIPQIPQAVIDKASPSTVKALTLARTWLLDDHLASALEFLASADQSEPAVLFARAVVTTRMSGGGRAIEAQRLLRGATEKGFAPAFTFYGVVLLRQLELEERGDLAASERVALDGSGRPVKVTAAQLAAEAVQWWQRGAAFHDPEAMRLLGMAEARGFNGKRNLPAAIAYWHDAAGRGDAIARHELGELYLVGTGVQADSEKAIELLRQASDQGVMRASLTLSSALLSKSLTGDIDAARESLRLLDMIAKKSPNRAERIFAHYMRGVYLTDVAPPAVRDPARGAAHFRFAAHAGEENSMKALSLAYETGLGVHQDILKAVGYLYPVYKRHPDQFGKDYARLSQRLSPAELERAQNFRMADDPVGLEFRAEYEVNQFIPSQFRRVESPLPPRATSPQPSATP